MTPSTSEARPLPGQPTADAHDGNATASSAHSPATAGEIQASVSPETVTWRAPALGSKNSNNGGGANNIIDNKMSAAALRNLPSRYYVLDEALQKESKWDGEPIQALALSGGGIKGIAFGEAVQALEEAGLYRGVTNFAGTSAGAGFASLLAVGYSGKEVSDILSTTRIGKIMMAGRWNCLWRLWKRSGLYTLAPFVKFMDALFQKRLGVAMCTLEQLHRRRGVNLVIPAINLDDQALVYLSHETYPRMPIAIACAASSAAPVMFEPVAWKGDRFVDGSLLDVLPSVVFDGKKTLAFSFVGMEDAMRAKTDLWGHVGNAGMVSKHQSGMSTHAAAGASSSYAATTVMGIKERCSKMFPAKKSTDLKRLATAYSNTLMVPPSGKLAELVASVVGILIAGANSHIDAALLKRLQQASCVDNVNIYTSDVDYFNFNVSLETSAYLRGEGYEAVRRYLDVQPSHQRNSMSSQPSAAPEDEAADGPLLQTAG